MTGPDTGGSYAENWSQAEYEIAAEETHEHLPRP